MRKLASIQKIKSLSPIPNADKIEKAEILGWEVVVIKNQFKVNDLVVFCEIDSILPAVQPFDFLKDRKFRIRTIRLKNQISQGIAFPLSVIKYFDPNFDLSSLKEDDDITDLIQVTKYDPEGELEKSGVVEPQVKLTWWQRKVKYWKFKLFNVKPVKSDEFPSDVPKTDEERVQKMGATLHKYQNYPAYITEKLEGSSVSIVYRKTGNWLAKLFGKGYVYQVCSRNRVVFNSQKHSTCTHSHYKAIEKYNLEKKLQLLNMNIAIQGEVIGPKIQGNLYNLPELDVRIFLMYNLDTKSYLTLTEMEDIARKLGLPLVPIISDNAAIVNDIKYYVGLSKGNSVLNPNILREGIVIRLHNSNVSFKSISPDYLLS